MKLFSLYRVELKRLALSKFVWVITVLSLFSPMLGYSLLIQTDSTVMTGKYIASPVLAGTFVSAILWAILAFIESNRVHRAMTDVLTDSIISPIHMAFSRMLALTTFSGITTLICIALYLPYTIIKLDYLFNFGLYIASFLIMMLPSWWISILLACALYQITQRIELSGLLYACCLSVNFRSYFARWTSPFILSFSDGFSSAYPLRIALYSRLIWLFISCGLWTLSLICIRQYQKGFLGSLFRGLRKVYIPITACVLISSGILMWIGQPFVDHGPYEWDESYGKPYFKKNSTRVSDVTYRLTAYPITGRLRGIAEYHILSSSGKNESIWLNPGYTISNVTSDGKAIDFETLKKDINNCRETVLSLPKGKQTLVVEYKGFPSTPHCFAPFLWDNEITWDYVSLNNYCSVPITNFHMPKMSNLELTLPEKLTPIVEHQMITDFIVNSNGTKTWHKLLSATEFLWITACDYTVDTIHTTDTDIEFIYSSKYAENIKEYNIHEAIRMVFDYCSAHQGSLQFIKGKNLMMLQRSGITGGGGNASSGWVEWDEQVFTSVNLNDNLKGTEAAEVFAHEIIHQWWGGLGVNCFDDGLWSDEGLTVYTTYRLMKEQYGELYAKKNYIDVWQANVDAQNREFYRRHPEYLSKLPEMYRAELNSRSFGINRYCRMPLMILRAEKLIGGEEKMDEILKSIQKNREKYYSSPLTYENFLDACGLTKEDLNLEKDF